MHPKDAPYLDAWDNIQSFDYGDEPPQQVEKSLLLSPQKLQDLPWNIRFRIWIWRLQRDENTARDKIQLPDILVVLRSETLDLPQIQDEKLNLDLLDLPIVGTIQEKSYWEVDHLLKYWKEHQRYLVVRDFQQYCHRISASDQVCLVEILNIIDQVTGYDSSSPDPTTGDANATSPRRQSTNTTEAVTELHPWLESLGETKRGFHLNHLYEKLGKEGSRGPTYRGLAQSMAKFSKQSRFWLRQQMTAIASVSTSDNEQIVRGKALLLHLLLAAGIGTKNDFLKDSFTYEQWNRGAITATSDTLDSLFTNIQNYLLWFPQKNRLVANVRALTNRIWDLAEQSDSVGAVLSVVQSFRDWLPLQDLLPRFQSVLLESLDLRKQRGHHRNASRNRKQFQNIVALALFCCEDVHLFRSEVLTDNCVYNAVLPVVFHHVLLVSGKNSKGWETPRDHDYAVQAAMMSFIGLLDAIGKESGWMGALPELVALVRMAAVLKLPDALVTEVEDYNILKDNCKAVQALDQSLAGQRTLPLKLPELCSAFFNFCKDQELAITPIFRDLVTKQWLDWSKREVVSEWISCAFREIMAQEEQNCISSFLRCVHASATEVYALSNPRPCWIELFLAVLESSGSESKFRTISNHVEVGDRIVAMTPPQYLFAGASRPLDAVFADALGAFENLRRYPKGVSNIMVSVAMQLEKTLRSEEVKNAPEKSREWVRCVSHGRRYMLKVIRSSNCNQFESWHQNVSSSLTELSEGPGKEWWKETSWDLKICNEHRHYELVMCTSARTVSDFNSNDRISFMDVHSTRKRVPSDAQVTRALAYQQDSSNDFDGGNLSVALFPPPRRRQRLDYEKQPILSTSKSPVTKHAEDGITNIFGPVEETGLKATSEQESEDGDDEVLLLNL